MSRSRVRYARMQSSRFAFGPLLCSTHGISDLLDEIRALLANPDERPRTVNCVNAHIFNLAWRDSDLAQVLNDSRVLAVDGMSIVWAARLLGVPLKERCNMTEALRAFLADPSFPETRAVLVGGTEETAALAAEEINRRSSHTTVVDSLSGYLDEQAYVSYFRRSPSPDVVFLGIGTPQSERLSHLLSRVQPNALIWHIGGGTILFLSGRLHEAPRWMRRSGLQWMHRLMLEPRRLWKRYLVGNVLFGLRFLGWLLRTRRRVSR